MSAETIKQAVLNKFNKIGKSHISTMIDQNFWTVVAGIVRTRKDHHLPEIIAVTTGTRADQIDENGLKLTDSHAEILARRPAPPDCDPRAAGGLLTHCPRCLAGGSPAACAHIGSY